MSTSPEATPRVRRVLDRPLSELPALQHPDWADRFPWLIQGTTTRGPGRPFDFALFGTAVDADAARAHWEALRLCVDARRVVHARQVHGAEVRVHGAEVSARGEIRAGSELRARSEVRARGREVHVERGGAPGLHLAEPCDAHVTSERGLLLAVTTADCVPVFLVDPRRRAVAVAHAGWRGAAAGVLERAIGSLARPRPGGSEGSRPASGERSRAEDLHVHLGPAICCSCYEVGREVFRALGLPTPDGPAPLDLRAALAERAAAEGVPSTSITVSGHCTRCTDSGLFSHRGGDAGRQVGYLGLRP